MASTLSLSALALGSVGIVTAFASKQYLDRSCPRIPINKVSRMSACRQLVDRACSDPSDADVPKPWGAAKSGLLASWSEASSDGRKSRWLPSYVAVQMDVPLTLLASYQSETNEIGLVRAENEPCTADGMARNLVAAFLDARSRGPDGWLIDRNVPSVSLASGGHLFGDAAGLSAFMFDSWSSRSAKSIQPSVLPANAPTPSAFFPSNEALIASHRSSQPESAGTVIYWKFPQGLVNAFNGAASYGWPWRLMDGGFQEFVVEKISDDTARVTYVSVECSNLYPGGQVTRNFKRMPWVVYEAHVLYAQSLLLGAVRQLRKANSA
ncbi:hypothetical protein N7457_003003 [Penicillium paradoxum]|uniref:uncharacterized protein n=1 Tax=Penicillium paradoxum TaxID=176176 RepID=UPI002547CBF4|nr:uncharacterized protein N7457_003003 [Penicillium paradoxum]KAJ5788013.1 hypothetical protein N7457_003003 [Penicillium paradoxum]